MKKSDREITQSPRVLCTKSDFNLIKRGIYKSQGNSINFGGHTYWLTTEMMETLKIKAKNHKADVSNLAFSMQEFMNKELIENLEFKDITDDLICLGIFGPKSRNLISKISNDDFSNETFKFGYGKFVTLGSKKVWAQRLSYVGELGFELYIENKDAKEIYQLIIEEGKNHNLSHCGSHAMDTMRMESGFLHWGHDISPEENQYEAGLNFAISYKKEIDFIGKESILKIKDKKQSRRFIMLSLKDSKPGTPLLLHEEPIYLEDKIIGRTTSGNYSFNYKKNLSFGYVSSIHSNEELSKMNLYIEVAKQKFPALVEIAPLKDKRARLL